MNGPRIVEWARQVSTIRVVPTSHTVPLPPLSQVAATCLSPHGSLKLLVRAAKSLRWVLRNSLLGSVAAWLSAELLASGTWIFTGRDPDKQSRDEFCTASAFWFGMFFSLFVQGMEVMRLLSRSVIHNCNFLVYQNAFRWMWLMNLNGSWMYVVFGASCNALSYYFIKRSRFVIYLSPLWMVHVSVAMNTISSNLYKVHRERALLSSGAIPSSRKPDAAQISSNETFESKQLTNRCRRILSKSIVRTWQRFLPMLFISSVSIGYVHVTTTTMLDFSNAPSETFSKATRSILFVVGSVALKFILQEAAKRVLMMRAGVPKLGQAMILIAMPTLLIDIQLRVVLLQSSSMGAATAIRGSLGLAMIEIVTRFVKMIRARAEADDSSLCYCRRGRDSRKSTRRVSVISGPKIIEPRGTQPRANQISSPSSTSIAATNKKAQTAVARRTSSAVMRRKTTRRSQILVIHACETFADMYAEYLALGCSYAVIIVFARIPHFNLYYTSASILNANFSKLLVLQTVIEVAVDAVSSAIEVALGLEVESIAQHTWSAASYMVFITFINVGLCAALYHNQT